MAPRARRARRRQERRWRGALVATTSYKVRNSGPVWSSTPHGAVRPGMAAYVGRPPGAAARRVRTARARPSPGAFRPFPSTASTCVAMRADGAVSGGERSRARMNGSSAQPPSSARPRCRSPPCLRGSAGLPRHERVHCRRQGRPITLIEIA